MPPQPTQADEVRPPAASPELLDRSDPEAEIARAVRAYSNWGRWGDDDVLGTVNFITDQLRLAAAGLVRRGASFSLSQRIPHLGLLIGEMWALEELAADCAADGIHEFLLTAAPLPITGAVGSPVNPIAVK